jgi:hypothetical protein
MSPLDRDGPEVVKEPVGPYAANRDGLREFVQRWAKAGPALEEQRCRDLRELDDEAARRMTLDLFELWRPSEFDEMGVGQVQAQRIFVKLARSEAQRQPER